jgi:hypothetical protein
MTPVNLGTKTGDSRDVSRGPRLSKPRLSQCPDDRRVRAIYEGDDLNSLSLRLAYVSMPRLTPRIAKRLRFLVSLYAAALVLLLIGCGGNGSGSGGGSGSSTPQIETSPHPPVRARYLRTDLQYNPNALQFFPSHGSCEAVIHRN